MEKRYFGTDGIRGHVGKLPITPEFVLKLGWAAGRALACEGFRKVLIGKDTRISGYMFESALEAGLSAAGVDIALLGPMPTPAVANLTRTLHASARIVISASHNPYYDNGIKFFGRDGKKLSDALELEIEAALAKDMETVDGAALGKAERIPDARGRYIEFCKRTVPIGLDLSGLNLVVDCANGATYHVAPSVFRELGARVSTLGTAPDGLNINRNCGSTDPGPLQEAVKAQQAHLGLAFDGDGDRVLMVDHRGEIVDGDELLYIIARDRLDQGLSLGAVVGTQMSNLGLELALKDCGVVLHRARVGDRYVMERLVAEDLLLGGEGSGHIICLDLTTTGDGIVSALQVLKAMVHSQKSLHELKAGMRKLPQTMVNVPMAHRVDVAIEPAIVAAVRDAEVQLGGRGRVLLRPSGTEPVVRVMVEGDDRARVASLAQELAEVVGGVISAIKAT
ncbi:MAG: phosphoglucosamine mutase [Candidatus Competibacterales bacterium]